MNIVIDIKPYDDPKDGAVLLRLTAEEHLQADSGIRVELYGFGSGIVVVNKNHPDVTDANFAPGNYCLVYDLDISEDIPLFGFFFEEQVFQVLSVDEEGGQVQRHGGRGVMTVLGRVVWDKTNYVNFGNDAQFGPRIDGRWYWYNDQYGDILKRAIDEAQDSDRPGYADLIPFVTYDFDSTNDSAGDPWVSFSGDYSIPIGQDYIETVQAFMDAGLIIRMDPDFLLQAFQTGGFGTDRTTTDYAADKVLFTSYFVEGVDANIVNRLPRSRKPAIQATRALIRGDSDEPASMRHRTLAGDVGREIFVRVDGTSAPETLDGAGDRALAAREDASDTPIFRHIPGQDALEGLYTPFPPGVALPALLLPRLYFANDPASSLAMDASWDVDKREPTSTQNLTTSDNDAGVISTPDNWSGLPKNICAYQGKYVLTGTVDFTGGSVRSQARTKAKSGIGIFAQGYQSQMVVRLFDSGGSLKGTLLAAHEPGSIDSQEWSNEGTGGPSPPTVNASFPADSQWADPFGAPLAGSLTGVAGDYLLIEWGGRHITGQDGPGAGFGMHAVGNKSGDLPVDQTTQSDLNGWIEFWGAPQASGGEGTYWVGDTVTIATGTGVGDYDYENKKVYAINWVLDDSKQWWPMPELGPIGDEAQAFSGGGGLSVGVGGSGSGGGGSGTSTPMTIQKLLTNESGGAVARGDVVVMDPDNDESFDTTSTAAETRVVGIAMEDIADGATGYVATHGYVELVTTTGSVTRGDYGFTSTTPKEADAATDRAEGAFCQFLKGGTAPSAVLFGPPDVATGGGEGGGEAVVATLAARVKRVAALNVTTSLAAISWDTELQDDGGFWAASPNPTRLTAPVDGWYLVGAQVSHTNANNNWMVGNIRLDGTTNITDFQDVQDVDNTPKALNMSTVIYLTAGQYVEVMIVAQATQALLVGELVAAWMVRIGSQGQVGDYAIERRTAGDLTISSTTVGAAVPTLGNLIIPARAGDVLLIGINAIVTDDSAASMRMDVATIVSAAVVNYVSSLSGTAASTGIAGWRSNVSELENKGPVIPYIVQSADVSGGNVELSLRAWNSSADNRTLQASTTAPLVFWAMKVLSGVPEITVDYVRAYHNAAQSVANTTDETVELNSERWDTANYHDLSTNNHRLTVPTGKEGLYLIEGNIEWATDNDGTRQLYFMVNATDIIANIKEQAVQNSTHQQSLSTLYYLNAGDFVDMRVRHSAGAALNLNSTARFSPEFGMVRVLAGNPGGAAGQQVFAPVTGWSNVGTGTGAMGLDVGHKYQVVVTAHMEVTALAFLVSASGTGTVQWGLFDCRTDPTACTKLAGGSGTLGGTGLQTIAASGSPVTIEPGVYILIYELQSTTAPTLRRSDNQGSISLDFQMSQGSYTWDDTPDITTGWSPNTVVNANWLVGQA